MMEQEKTETEKLIERARESCGSISRLEKARAVAERVVTAEIEAIWQTWRGEVHELFNYVAREFRVLPHQMRAGVRPTTSCWSDGRIKDVEAQLYITADELQLSIGPHDFSWVIFLRSSTATGRCPFVDVMTKILLHESAKAPTDPLYYLEIFGVLLRDLKDVFETNLNKWYEDLGARAKEDVLALRERSLALEGCRQTLEEIAETCRNFPRPSKTMRAIREKAERVLAADNSNIPWLKS